MFDIGWTEILILAVISLFVIGPKDIPKFLGYIGKLIGKVRGITSEFKETVDDAIKNSELEEVRKEISFTDPALSKNFNQVLNPSNMSKLKKENVDEKKVNAEEDKIEKGNDDKKLNQNYEFAGPTNKLPSGLKHIRGISTEEDKDKSKTDES